MTIPTADDLSYIEQAIIRARETEEWRLVRELVRFRGLGDSYGVCIGSCMSYSDPFWRARGIQLLVVCGVVAFAVNYLFFENQYAPEIVLVTLAPIGLAWRVSRGQK